MSKRHQCNSKCDGKKVYFITDGEFVKIGHAVSINGRLSSMQSGNPRVLSIAGSIDGCCIKESELHKIFLEYHHRGEWFKITGRLQKFLLSLITVKKPEQIETVIKRTIESEIARCEEALKED